MSQYQPGQQPAQPKKKHTVRNVLLIVFAILALFFVGCTVLVGAAFNSVDNAITESEERDNEPGGPNNPLEITEGEPFEVLDFAYSEGWSVGADELGLFTVSDLRVTNNRDDRDSALVEIKLMRGSEVVALADCTTEPVNVGQTTSLSCFSGDDFTDDYDAITINDSF